MDEQSVSFFENHLSDICNTSDLNFTSTNLLVTLETLFKMMENGQYSVHKLKLIFLHLMKINNEKITESESSNQSELICEGNDELIIDMINKYWSKALGQWLPSAHYEKVCKYLSDFLLQKALVSNGYKTKDYCISKVLCYASGDSKTIKLIATWILDLEY